MLDLKKRQKSGLDWNACSGCECLFVSLGMPSYIKIL